MMIGLRCALVLRTAINKDSLARIWFGVDIPRVPGDAYRPEFYQRIKDESEHLETEWCITFALSTKTPHLW